MLQLLKIELLERPLRPHSMVLNRSNRLQSLLSAKPRGVTGNAGLFCTGVRIGSSFPPPLLLGLRAFRRLEV